MQGGDRGQEKQELDGELKSSEPEAAKNEGAEDSPLPPFRDKEIF